MEYLNGLRPKPIGLAGMNIPGADALDDRPGRKLHFNFCYPHQVILRIIL